MKVSMNATVSGGFLSVDGPSLVRAAGQRLGQRLADETLAEALPNVPRFSEDLANSGHTEPMDDGARVVFDAEYAAFVHGPMDGSGGQTVPHWPPWGPDTPLAAWAEAHGIPAYLVARAISEHGTKLVPFLTDAKNAVMDGLFQGIATDEVQALVEALHAGAAEVSA